MEDGDNTAWGIWCFTRSLFQLSMEQINIFLKCLQPNKNKIAFIIGKPADDDVKLGALKLKPNTKIMMMGTREESLVNNSLVYQLKQEKMLCVF